MLLNHESSKPIYVQIAEWLEAEILKENILINGKMYSQYQLAEMFNINPATAAKGLKLLLDEELLYKKRGLGMFVQEDAKEKILSKRKNENLKRIIKELIQEADYLGISDSEMIEIIKQVQKERGES